ncbi:host attachment protein [Rubrivivax sp. RP6-9]|uniref:host attachment protein n=1 Tax=Rubrivivax sp. RP6-9 TaxID=3415750 RepID=UPI003CC606FD
MNAMPRPWLVVANAARARVLEETDVPGCYLHVADLVHPTSRLQGRQLRSDRPGHVMRSGPGASSTAFAPRTQAHDREHHRFAQELAAVLHDGVGQGRCGGVTLVASDPFLGVLKAHLHTRVRQALLRTVSHDYTALRDDELALRLGLA